MGIAKGQLLLVCGEDEIFGQGVAKSMVGQTTADGWVIVKATQLSFKEILVHVEVPWYYDA